MNLPPRQREVLRFVREYWAEKGYGPSIRDVARWLGVNVHAAVSHRDALGRKGLMTWDANIARSLRLTAPPGNACCPTTKTEEVVD